MHRSSVLRVVVQVLSRVGTWAGGVPASAGVARFFLLSHLGKSKARCVRPVLRLSLDLKWLRVPTVVGRTEPRIPVASAGGVNMSKVVRLVPRAARGVGDRIDDAVALLDDDRISDAERSIIRRALERVRPDVSPGLPGCWEGLYTMLNRKMVGVVWSMIDGLPRRDRPAEVRRVFDQVLLNLNFDTGEVGLTRDQLAEAARMDARAVTKAMAVLAREGVIVREYERLPGVRGRGRAVYSINPYVAWTGDLAIARERAKQVRPSCLPLLRLVEESA